LGNRSIEERNALVLAHRHIAEIQSKRAARMVRAGGFDYDDFRGAAMEALIRAAERWQDTGAPFPAYAALSIRGEMMKIVHRFRTVVPLTKHAQYQLTLAWRAQKEARAAGSTEDEADEIAAKAAKLDVETLRSFRRHYSYEDVSIEAPIDEHRHDSPTIGETLPDTSEPHSDTVRRHLDTRRMARSILRDISTIKNGRNARVMRALLVEGKRPIDVGREFGISRERVRQIRDAEVPRLQCRTFAQFGKKAVADVLA